MMENHRLVGVRNRTVVEVKHKGGSFNASLDARDWCVGAIAHDLYKVGNNLDAKGSKLNVGCVAAETRVSVDIVKKFYQEALKAPLEKEELLPKAHEVYLRLNELSGTEGRRREDVTAIPPLVDEAVKYQENLTQCITPFKEAQRACKKKDAEIKKLERACEEKDAEINELRRRFKESKKARMEEDAENNELRRRLEESNKACMEKDAKIIALGRENEELKVALEEAFLATIDPGFIAGIDVCMRENPLPEFSGEYTAANSFP